MSTTEWLGELRQEFRDDLEETREHPVRETARLTIEGLLGLGLLYRLTLHVLVVAETTEHAQPFDVTYRYRRCHVEGVSDAVAHRARVVTGVVGLGLVWTGQTLVAPMAPAYAVLLGVNAAVLVGDPISPLVIRS